MSRGIKTSLLTCSPLHLHCSLEVQTGCLCKIMIFVTHPRQAKKKTKKKQISFFLTTNKNNNCCLDFYFFDAATPFETMIFPQISHDDNGSILENVSVVYFCISNQSSFGEIHCFLFMYIQLDKRLILSSWRGLQCQSKRTASLSCWRHVIVTVWTPRSLAGRALCRCSQPGAKLRGSAQASSLGDKSEELSWHLMPDWSHDPAGRDPCLGHVQSCDPLTKWWLGDSPSEAASALPSDACSVHFCSHRIVWWIFLLRLYEQAFRGQTQVTLRCPMSVFFLLIIMIRKIHF